MTAETRNLVLATVLMMVVLFGWPLLVERFLGIPATAPPAAPDAAAPPASAPPAAPAVAPPAVTPQTLPDALRTSPRVAIRAPRLEGSINLVGARIDDLVLPTHRVRVEAGAPPVRLFAPSGLPQGYFAGFGWVGSGAPPPDARWTADAPTLTPERPVTLTWTSPSGAVFRIRLAIVDDYLLEVTQTVENRGPATIELRPYGFVNRTGTGPEQDAFNLHVGPIAVIDGVLKEGEVGYDRLREDGPRTYATQGGWLGITDKYWLAALIPDQRAPVGMRFVWSPQGDRYQTDVTGPAQTVPPGTSARQVTHLYAGAKEVAAVNRTMERVGAPLFDRAIAWGWFWFLAQPIFWLLKTLHDVLGNWGLAIVGLTVVVRVLLFPIANRQYASMARLKLFAPRVKELQERYRDDKVRLQQEMLELYRKEKINPLAGCLPILLQIPIFYALYKTLLIAIEIRHQPLGLWIRDLSAPDPLTPVNLFGLLPFEPPAFLAVGVLPILLGVTMWLQFRLNPAPMDDVQKAVFAWMPWIFMVLMAPFAAGLQLYWIVNNLISILQQLWLNRKYASPAPAPARGE
ncbi:MAG: membrane protein insertase YidC [Sphingomonadaceae bacterium]|uniref:membrane protein insertase YidC n=1 Tax=Thermaurantiacus sp. TaxID=2820283 RepID=UPI00298F00DE|nr:membrane protein insertase YidC [Thermaurantiacus sp.]MCS6987292.1 membrane protein insertase YidC [Sphingomonadaceae bacterium]MDW8414512.1 membrane protein insertase YidC [Thermaurantiacus sp.]